MRKTALLLFIPALVSPLQGAKWPTIPKEVWAMSKNPALVAKGAVILERKLDFQPDWFEQTLRVRILGEAGLAAAELADLPETLVSLEGQVTFPDGRVVPIGKRETFTARKAASPDDGAMVETGLLPPGLTSDCVVELRWRELTDVGAALFRRMPITGKGHLPERFGPFKVWTLGSAFPTQSVVVQRAKEMYWPLIFSSTAGFNVVEGSTSMGTTFTIRDIPGHPRAPFANDLVRPVPKVVVFKPIASVGNLLSKVPAMDYWQKVVDLFYKDWYTKFVAKGEAYRTFSAAIRKDLTGGPRDKARTIAERLAAKTVNIDHLVFGEKLDPLARWAVDEGAVKEGSAHFMESGGDFSTQTGTGNLSSTAWTDARAYNVDAAKVSSLNYMARSGFVDNKGAVRLLFNLLADEGIPAKIGLVADRRLWMVNPEVRSPFQFTHNLLGVDEPGQPTLWLDPTDRLLPVGQMPTAYQSTKAVTIDSATWKAGVQDIRVEPAAGNTRIFTFEVDASSGPGKATLQASFLGAPALAARSVLAAKSPADREAWFQETLGRGGLTGSKVEVANATDPSQPLAFNASGTLALVPGATLKINPFPGMDAPLYVPAAMPAEREEPILLPSTGVQEATSTVKVPAGYVLPKPVVSTRSTQWGTVILDVRQDPGTGELTARMKVSTLGVYNHPAAYPSLKDYLNLMKLAVAPEVTLEKAP